MATEGNLQAPTRHALDWKHPDFHDKDACLPEHATKRVRSVAPEAKATVVKDTTINTIERCSGHAGTFGEKKATHQMRQSCSTRSAWWRALTA